MRKIEQQMLAAVKEQRTWSSGNTQVTFSPYTDNAKGNRSAVYLHGNHIATYLHDADNGRGALVVNECTLRRWPTPTTKSRLRALGANVATKGGVTYLDGRPL